MKIKKHIKAKRQYVSPSIYVKVLQMEGHIAGPSAYATGGNGGSGDGEGEGGNPPIKPFGAKADSRVFFDDETEE